MKQQGTIAAKSVVTAGGGGGGGISQSSLAPAAAVSAATTAETVKTKTVEEDSFDFDLEAEMNEINSLLG